MTFHSSMFGKSSNKLVLKRIHSKNKKVQGKLNFELDLNGVLPSRIVQVHEAMGETLNMSVGEMDNENATLKNIIKEIESDLMRPPIFYNPISTMHPWKSPDGTLKSISRLRGTLSLLDVVRRYVG
jgi:hypothetical protein